MFILGTFWWPCPWPAVCHGQLQWYGISLIWNKRYSLLPSSLGTIIPPICLPLLGYIAGHDLCCYSPIHRVPMTPVTFIENRMCPFLSYLSLTLKSTLTVLQGDSNKLFALVLNGCNTLVHTYRFLASHQSANKAVNALFQRCIVVPNVENIPWIQTARVWNAILRDSVRFLWGL